MDGDAIEDTIAKLEYDLCYIKNISLGLDFFHLLPRSEQHAVVAQGALAAGAGFRREFLPGLEARDTQTRRRIPGASSSSRIDQPAAAGACQRERMSWTSECKRNCWTSSSAQRRSA